MNFKLLKTGLLVAALGLASCGGDSGTTPSTTAGTTAGTTVVAPNTGTITVMTLPNNVVSIGASGTNFKTADATGKAVFTGLPAGAVDVHIFSADGYSAVSYMGFNAASITDTSVGGNGVIDVYVQTINPDPYSFSTYYLTTATNTYEAYDWAGTGNVSFGLWDVAPGATVSGTLYALQGNATSSAGNSVSGGAEAINLGNVSLTTTATSGAAQQSFIANFTTPVPTPPLLATVQSVTPPTGMPLQNVSLGTTAVYGAFNGATQAPLTFPDTIRSVDIGDHTYSVYAGDPYSYWSRTGTFTVGGSISVAATLTTAPTMTAGQAGTTLSWTNGAGASPLVVTDIYDSSYTYDWTILSAGGTTSVTLPTVPAGVASPLTIGSPYLVDVFNYKEFSGANYEQIITFFNGGGTADLEMIGVQGVAYTR